jgi:tripartite-type tricarboxylate transporter receptor subunit TctC
MLKVVRLAMLAVVIASAATAVAAQGYPTRTIEIVVAYGPGGSTDLVARALAQKFQERLGQSAVVLNKAGGSGTIGATVAARAAPDGYTLYVGYTSETVIVPQLAKGIKYSVDDFEPIAVTGLVPLVLITSKNIRAGNLRELIEELRAQPGKFTYGGGIASPPHVMGAWFNRLNNLSVTHVPYRGGGQAVADVVGGHIDLFFAGLAAAKGAIDSGAVKAFAVTGDARSSGCRTCRPSRRRASRISSWRAGTCCWRRRERRRTCSRCSGGRPCSRSPMPRCASSTPRRAWKRARPRT